METVEHTTPVLVVGAGPAGLISALQLSRQGTRCMLIERNLTTTKWPKMDITNCRSMELLKRLGVDTGLREVGVPQNYSFDVNFSTGLSDGGQLIEKWHLPSPDEWRARIREQNDGSMPQEPYQRCSQAIFEAWLKPKLEANPLVETHFGWKFESLVESDTHVECKLTDQTGKQHIVRSQYVIGCDGAGSKVREAIGSKMEGGPVPQAMHLIHFKSRDLTRLHKQGQFWHIFFTSGAIIIAQDEVDTWTIHRPVPVDTDVSGIDPRETIYQALGGECAPFEIEIDDILITNVWRPTMALADKYASVGKRVFISGDAAHQNIPTGGYGMNTAVGDSFDIGWKLAAVLTGHGGPQLLASYETERRPVGARNVEHCGMHFLVHAKFLGWCSESPQLATAATSEGQALRDKVAEHVRNHNGENTDHGIELGYRYNGSPVIIGDSNVEEPVWEAGRYVPSTWPGARAPSVFLKTQPQTSIFDLFGTGAEFTLVDLSVAGEYAKAFAAAAARAEPKLPLKTLHLPNEPHLRRVWERDAVLVRPDDHVAWRAPEEQAAVVDADAVLATAAGW